MSDMNDETIQADSLEAPKVPPLWRRIAEELGGDIQCGRFPPGSPLPTVMTLAERFGVNRHTVRQALQALQARGLVSVEQGRGSFVRTRSYDYKLGRRIRFRNSFTGEGGATTLVIQSMTIEPLSPKEALRLSLPDETPAWMLRTMRLVDGMPLLTSVHRLEEARFPDFGRVLQASQNSFTTAFEHFGITDYVRLSTRITATQATEEERQTLQLDAGQPVLFARGIDGTPDGKPFHSVGSAFAGDRIEFVLEAGSGLAS